MSTIENITDFVTKYSGFMNPDLLPVDEIMKEASRDWGFISFGGGSSNQAGLANSSRASLDALFQPKIWGHLESIKDWYSSEYENASEAALKDYIAEWEPDLHESSQGDLIKISKNPSDGGCESAAIEAPHSIGAVAVITCLGYDGGFVNFTNFDDLRIPITPTEIIIAPADFPFRKKFGTSGETLYLTRYLK